MDLEKAAAHEAARTVHVRTEVVVESERDVGTFQDFLKSSRHSSGKGW